MISRDEARTRVARGAAHLDQVRPGWHDRIDVGTLTLWDPCGCIVGQLVPGTCCLNFNTHAEYIFGRSLYAKVENGVDLPPHEVSRYEYGLLQDAWIEAIAARRHPVCEHQDSAPTVAAVSDPVEVHVGSLRV